MASSNESAGDQNRFLTLSMAKFDYVREINDCW
jgi:hypothetical protein